MHDVHPLDVGIPPESFAGTRCIHSLPVFSVGTTQGDNAIWTKDILHIVETSELGGGEMLLRFSDGSSAVYQCEELEKLRPRVTPAKVERKIA
jgi:hypothetical protein